jgi:hypothetical protein
MLRGSQLALAVVLISLAPNFPAVSGAVIGSTNTVKEGVFYQCPKIQKYNCTFIPEKQCGYKGKYKSVPATSNCCWQLSNPSVLRYR